MSRGGGRILPRKKLAYYDRFFYHLRRLLCSSSGISLVETIVAGAIVAVAALILATFVFTLSGISHRSADIAASDEATTETIALDPADKTSSDSMTITLSSVNGTTTPGDPTIDITHNTYESGGRSLSTFELPPATTSGAGTTP